MKCQSCQCEVPPAFVHAIQTNVCPGCANPIMDEQMVELMRGLADAMSQMEYNPQGIAGWLMDNYRLEKVGPGEPTGFHQVKKHVTVGVAGATGTSYTDEKTERLNKFFENAGAPKNVVGMTKKDLVAQNEAAATAQGQSDVEDEMQEEDILAIKRAALLEKQGASEEVSSAMGLGSMAVVPGAPDPYAQPPVNDLMSPHLRALREQQQQKIEESRNAVLSGVRVNKNGFTRAG